MKILASIRKIRTAKNRKQHMVDVDTYLMSFERNFAWNVGLAFFAENPTVDNQVEVSNVGMLVVPVHGKDFI